MTLVVVPELCASFCITFSDLTLSNHVSTSQTLSFFKISTLQSCDILLGYCCLLSLQCQYYTYCGTARSECTQNLQCQLLFSSYQDLDPHGLQSC